MTVGTRIPYDIISVDDHVLEPPDLWWNRLPAKLRDRGPRVVRERGVSTDRRAVGWKPDHAGQWADVWYYEGVVKPLVAVFVAAGTDHRTVDYRVMTYDDVRPGCWKQAERLADMSLDHTEASLCFPNTLPRFCGQTFAEQKDKDLALLCVQAYNDWMIEDWTSGEARGRLIPLVLIPLWDAGLAAAEIRRCAGLGAYAVSFTEGPEALGLPSLYTGSWDPLFAACEETGTTICIHIGSSSRVPTTSPDAPPVASSIINFQNGMHSLVDMLLSGVVVRFPQLQIAYSECNVGWMAYVLERMDKVWRNRGRHTEFGRMDLPEPPSSYVAGRIFGCIIDDESGLAVRDQVGVGQICYETDYPHSDGLFPHSAENVAAICAQAGLSDEEMYAFIRGNAIRAFHLERFGVTA
jgi:predicted TIM-barrel fold metal-dependent hydrolase